MSIMKKKAARFHFIISLFVWPIWLLFLCIIDEQKLVIGTRTCNLLVASSFRLDSVSVNMGSTISYFKPSNSTKIYVDKHSIELVKTILSDPTAICSQTLPSLYMLKQVRSKFDRISTYTQCRSSSSIASRLEYQPVTI